jgi:hypothetical protein
MKLAALYTLACAALEKEADGFKKPKKPKMPTMRIPTQHFQKLTSSINRLNRSVRKLEHAQTAEVPEQTWGDYAKDVGKSAGKAAVGLAITSAVGSLLRGKAPKIPKLRNLAKQVNDLFRNNISAGF